MQVTRGGAGKGSPYLPLRPVPAGTQNCHLFRCHPGAEVVGDEELVARILESGGGGLQFDKCIATPDMMPKLGKVGEQRGRVLEGRWQGHL